MTWSKRASKSSVVCLSCGLDISRKPQECSEPKHDSYYQNRLKGNREYRKKRRKDDVYYATGFDKESWKKYSRQKYRGIKLGIIEKLGGTCWCGFDDPRALHIDHKNGGGTKERRKYGWGYLKMLNRLAVEKLKEDYQILCANHHAIKSWEEAIIDD